MFPPTVIQLDESILRLKRLQPGIPAVICKRDAVGAYCRIYLRPDMSSASASYFPAEAIGLTHDITMSHLVFPFGWLESTSFYQVLGESAALHRQEWGPIQPDWRGGDSPRQYTFCDDSMCIGSSIGNSPGRNGSWRVLYIQAIG